MTDNKNSKAHARAIQAETGRSYADAKRIASALHDIQSAILQHPHDPGLAQLKTIEVLRSAGVKMDAPDQGTALLGEACSLATDREVGAGEHRTTLRWVMDSSGRETVLRLIVTLSTPDTLAHVLLKNEEAILAVHDSLEMEDDSTVSEILQNVMRAEPATEWHSNSARVSLGSLDAPGLARMLNSVARAFDDVIPF